MIYLDNAATTRPSRLALRTFNRVSNELWDNPSSVLREPGIAAKRLLNESRDIVADRIGADANQIFFTSGATEAANWLLRNVRAYPIITSMIEHPCVYETCEDIFGDNDIEYIPTQCGMIDIDALCDRLDMWNDGRRNILVCIMHTNNETGVIQNTKKIAEAVHSFPNAYLMVDMTQSFAHAVDFRQDELNYDFAFGSGQKFGAFKGTGFAYMKYPELVHPLLTGGHQEFQMRAGTENVAGIYAMARQFHEKCQSRPRDNFYECMLTTHLITNLPDWCHVNFQSGSNIVSIRMDGHNGQDVVSKLALQGIYVSAGSACSTGEDKPSRVLMASGLTENEARSTIRVSVDADENSVDDINGFLESLRKIMEEK